MTGFAYGAALMVYQFGLLLQGGSLTFWSAVAFLLMGMLLFLLFRPKPREHVHYEPMAYGSGCQGACPAGCKGCPSNTANRKHRGRNRI
jgi:hypothetical protein